MEHPTTIFSKEPAKAAYHLRPISPEDNPQVATLIRTVMTEFGCVGEGYSINDPEVDGMYEAYAHGRAAFFVIADGASGEVLGCGGIGPLPESDGLTCELKKMYFYPTLRGLGFGRKMVDHCLATAQQLGYQRCYLETVARMEQANRLYQKMGFQKICSPQGATGHGSCDAWYTKQLIAD